MGRLLFVILISLFAVKASLADQPTAESSHTTGDILGSVNICPQLGVDRVVAYIPGRSYVVRSAPNGSFEFNFVPEGTYDIAFESNGARVGSLSGVVVTSKQQTNLGEVFVCIDADGDGFDATQDCNDSNPNIHPNALEACNNIDDNCNGLIDEGFPTQTYYRDADLDSFGNPAIIQQACAMPSGYVANKQDCYDSNSFARPNQTSFFPFHRGDSSFDYNCNTIEEKQYPNVGSCTLNASQTACVTVLGWERAVPSCGGFGSMILGCSYVVFPTPTGTEPGCMPTLSSSMQSCR